MASKFLVMTERWCLFENYKIEKYFTFVFVEKKQLPIYLSVTEWVGGPHLFRDL